MVPDDFHDFFVGSASVAGALIGLLFVAISVSGGRLSGDGAQVHRIRAAAALTAFLNTLSVSLFSLIPGHVIGPTAVSVGAAGLAFVAGSMLSLVRLRQVHWGTVRDALFMIGLAVTFVVQLLEGLDITSHPDDPGAVQTISILVVVCFLIGIARAWELMGGPSIGLTSEVTKLVRQHAPGSAQPTADRAEAGRPGDSQPEHGQPEHGQPAGPRPEESETS